MTHKFMKNKGLNILLKKNLSKGQLAGYAIANIIGLTVILSGILFYCDSRHDNGGEDKYFSDDYIVLSKEVKGLSLEPTAFTEEELKEIENQPWVKKTGRFTSSQYSVSASVQMGNSGMSTHLFFESVPDDFFDKKPDDWTFDPSNKFIPIVLNKDYLALYNFGFAIPQGLPQLSEDLIGSVPLIIKIRGANGITDTFDGAIVGFSSRLNTIAVPQEFMDWANNRYAPKEEISTSRIILKTDRLKSAEMEKYINDNGYQIGGDKSSDSKLSGFLALVAGVVSANGLIIALLALFILILSIFLLLQKSRDMLRNLLLLGYAPRQAGKYYERTVIFTNSLITLIAVGLTFLCRLIWTKPLEALGLGHANVLFMIGAAVIYFIIITFVNVIIIRSHLLRIWHNR